MSTDVELEEFVRLHKSPGWHAPSVHRWQVPALKYCINTCLVSSPTSTCPTSLGLGAWGLGLGVWGMGFGVWQGHG
jgi:hypothetical protein